MQEKSPHQHQHQCWLLLLLTYFELSSSPKPDPEPSQVSLLAVAAVRGWAGLRWSPHLTASPSLTQPHPASLGHRTEARCRSVPCSVCRCGPGVMVTLGMVRVVTGCCWWCTAHGCSHGGTECCVLEVASLASSRYSTACSVHTVHCTHCTAVSSPALYTLHYTTTHSTDTSEDDCAMFGSTFHQADNVLFLPKNL